MPELKRFAAVGQLIAHSRSPELAAEEFAPAFRALLGSWAIDPGGGIVTVLGAGGAARAAMLALVLGVQRVATSVEAERERA